MLVDKGKAYLLAGVFFKTRETQICTKLINIVVIFVPNFLPLEGALHDLFCSRCRI
jgi:hypothetical protein